jgi:phage-related protein
MKRLILLTSALAIFALTTKAQNKVDNSVNKANNAVNSANNSVNNASSTAQNAVGTAQNTTTQVKGLTDQVGGLFGAKKKTVGSVTIKVPGANRAKLKELTAIVKTCQGVDARDVDFDEDQQNIIVGTYKGKVNDLLEELEKKSPQVTDNNSKASRSDNSITITL